MIRKTTWHPDTCKCVIEQSFDYAEDGTVTHLEGQDLLMRVCGEHLGEKDHAKVCSGVLSENRLKNEIINKIVDKIPDENEKEIYRTKFSFDENRKLKVEAPVGLDVSDVAVGKEDKVLIESK